jgi:hypothetical protein
VRLAIGLFAQCPPGGQFLSQCLHALMTHQQPFLNASTA